MTLPLLVLRFGALAASPLPVVTGGDSQFSLVFVSLAVGTRLVSASLPPWPAGRHGNGGRSTCVTSADVMEMHQRQEVRRHHDMKGNMKAVIS